MTKQHPPSPLPQVIISGAPVTAAVATEVRAWCISNGLFALEWCHPTGTIGYLDMACHPVDSKVLKSELQLLAQQFNTLDLGVSLMSGPTGAYNSPVSSFRVFKGKVVHDLSPHVTHRPPTRWKG